MLVAHVPGLVERGCCSTYRRPHPGRWLRLARVLLRLNRLVPSVLELGHDAIIASMLHYAWRPGLADVRYQLLHASGARPLPASFARPPRTVEDLADARRFAGELEAAGLLAEAQMLRRSGKSYTDIGAQEDVRCGQASGQESRVLEVAVAEDVWRQLDLSELCCIEAQTIPPEARDDPSWHSALSFRRKPMRREHWEALRKASPGVGRLRQRRQPALRAEACASDEEDQRAVLLDWCRFVAAMRPKERLVEDVQELLEAMSSVFEDHAFLQVQGAMQVLGETLANVVLPQPDQSQMVLQEDAYTRAANLALDEARLRIYRAHENETERDFAELRQQVIDVLKGVSLAISNGHHDGKLGHVLQVTGLLAVDWSLPFDCVEVQGTDADGLYQALRCDTLRRSEGAYFSCWAFAGTAPLPTRESALLLCSVTSARATLLQFALPVSQAEAARLSGIPGDLLEPLKPSRWARRRAALLSEAHERGASAADFNAELFSWDYRLYLRADGWRLAPLLVASKRAWHLVSPDGSQISAALLDAEPCLPPFRAEGAPPDASVRLRAGPDSRLRRALRLLSDAPEQLRASLAVHRRGARSLRPPVQAGTPFLVGNLSSPKKAAASLLRMPIFGAGFGVRSSMGMPLAGSEVSPEALGSANRAFTSVQANESRRVRRCGNNEKEVTAYWNKKATQKSSTARVTVEGRVEGACHMDGHCRAVTNGGLLCMGQLTRNLECRRCGKLYIGEEEIRSLYRRKRLLEDAGPLRLSKKLRKLEFSHEGHGLLCGGGVKTIIESVRELQPGAPSPAMATLPPHYRLSRDRQLALAYPGVVYVLDAADRLRAVRRALPSTERAPALDAAATRWLLPVGHGILVERASDTCARAPTTGAGGGAQPPETALLDEAEWQELRGRCELLERTSGASGSAAPPAAVPSEAAPPAREAAHGFKFEPGSTSPARAPPVPAAEPRQDAWKIEGWGAELEMFATDAQKAEAAFGASSKWEAQAPGQVKAERGTAARASACDAAGLHHPEDYDSDGERNSASGDTPTLRLNTRHDAALQRQLAARKALEAAALLSDEAQRHAALQFDVPLKDLDFVVLLAGGQSFRGLPFLQRPPRGGARLPFGSGKVFETSKQVRLRAGQCLPGVHEAFFLDALETGLGGGGVHPGAAILSRLADLLMRRLPAPQKSGGDCSGGRGGVTPEAGRA